MLNIKPYFPVDYPRLLPFLKKFDPTLPEQLWENLLHYKWENKFEYSGMLLENNNEIVGFLCYIISHKSNSDTEYTFCNISSWVVNPEFRSESLKLLSKAFQIKNLVLVNLSPHENTLPIFTALRFDYLAEFEYRINPLKIKFASRKLDKGNLFQCKKIDSTTAKAFEPKIRKIILDNIPFENVRFYEFSKELNGARQSIILAFNRKKMVVNGLKNKLKEAPYLLLKNNMQFELLYCSSPQMLFSDLNEILLSLIPKSNIRSINISEHFFDKKDLPFHFVSKIKKDRPWFLYTDTNLTYSEIDILYSEKVLLNL